MVRNLTNECEQWVKSLMTAPKNERDMQVQLAMYLKSLGYIVHTEYAVPLKMLTSYGISVPEYSKDGWSTPDVFPWHNQMYLDIVVEKNGKFAVIELKYATTRIDTPILVFNQLPPEGIEIIKHHGAADLVMYNYWKDVRRIEAVSRISNVVGGVAIIITNDKTYWNAPDTTSGYLPFSTHEGNCIGGNLLVWGNTIGKKIRKSHPDFLLDGRYPCHWTDTNITAKAKKDKSPFKYMISTVLSNE